MDRYELFDSLMALFEKIDTEYRVIDRDGFKLDLLDVLVASLYLGAIQSQYEGIEDSFPYANLPVHKKILLFPKRLLKRLDDYSQLIEQRRIASSGDNSILTEEDVVFFPVEPTHLVQQIPVAKILVECGKRICFVTNKKKLYDKLQEEGFSVHFIQTNSTSNSSINFNTQMLFDQIKMQNNQSENSRIESDVLEFICLKIKYLLNGVVAMSDRIYQLVTQIKPRAVVDGNDFTLEGRITARICKLMNISSANIMHGSIAGEPLDSLHIVDKFFLYGSQAKDYLVSLGLSASNLIVTGDPHIDKVVVGDKSIHPLIKKELPLKTSHGYILLALSGPGHCTTHEHFDKIVNGVVSFSVKEQNIDIIAKLHRKDSKDNYSKIKQHHPGNSVHVVEYNSKGFPKNIYDWLRGCKLVITGSSTVAIEAMLMGIPVITVDFMNEYQGVDFIDTGATIHVTKEEELHETIYDAFSSAEKYSGTTSKAQQYIESYYYMPDGNASQRIADHLIESMGIN